MENNSKLNPAELPFLVTHWLSNFHASNEDAANDDAVRRLQDAASQMASAFTDMGVFGTANKPLIKTRYSTQDSQKRRSYDDMKRQWSHVPPNQLEMVVEASASVATASTNSVHLPSTNLFHMAQEIRPIEGGGRRLGETIDLTCEEAKTDSIDSKVLSILQTIPLFGESPDVSLKNASRILPYRGPGREDECKDKTLNFSVVSEFERLAKSMGEAMRSFLTIREEFRAEAFEMSALESAIDNQKLAKANFEKDRCILNNQLATETLSDQSNLDSFTRTENLIQEIQHCDRIIAQLGIKLDQLMVKHSERKQRLFSAERGARELYLQNKHVAVRFRDPFQLPTTPSLCGTLLENSGQSHNHLTTFLMTRQYGMSKLCNARQIGRPMSVAAATQARKAVIASRFCHSITINAHLTYPVYCLQFDKSGRYFVTGADDCLVKLFCIGASPSGKAIGARVAQTFTYGANGQGAVLVCTLRGHAGVICDIDVSSDNAFVATASDDGDVRVWGMKDGCPIAILRGHEGGANMVSWSTLTPFRLVSSGMDGLAKIWDVRDAALKRYAAHISKRIEYTLPLSDVEKRTLSNQSDAERPPLEENGVRQIMLPPLPPREGENDAHAADPAVNVALPAAPDAPNIIDEDAAEALVENNDNPGAFVANDILDEGIRLVARLQHGEMIQESGPGTRSRRKQVKVICVARCPRGGTFATGSDDGQCRVWEDEDDERLALIDNRGMETSYHPPLNRKRSSTDTAGSSTSKLLTTLVGHMGSITDLHYSYAGDRIVTASQKDGNARIWSFGNSTRTRQLSREVSLRNRFLDAKQIVLRLSNVNVAAHSCAQARPSRRRGGSSASSSASSVTCDVAVWTSDDTKIVTSQSCPEKSNSQDILPGSQLLLVWDSWSGNCLLAIKQAHSQQCPVVITHPLEPSIMCSAGLDGVAKLWDLETGTCLFSHKNSIDVGPIAPNNERGKESGYLDGTFDPHGQHLLLTDDNGRITMFDCMHSPAERDQPNSLAWMAEQYFANDYYELFYNTNGYCVERGSEQPPHLAPRAARCNHAGTPWSDDVCETFRLMKGPSPTSEAASAAERKMLRTQAQGHLPGADDRRRAVIMMDFDPARTVQVNGSSEKLAESQHSVAPPVQPQIGENDVALSRRTTSSGRSLSSNYRWRDYEDLIREEGLQDAGDPDVGDEEFVPRGMAEEDDDLSDAVLSDSEFQMGDDSRSSNRRASRTRDGGNERLRRANRRDNERARVEDRNASSLLQARSSRRRARTKDADSDDEDSEHEESDDDDGLVEQVLSTNNAPSGPFADDYNVDGHLFKLGSATARVNRGWLLRSESSSSYKGRKVYSPQVGDSVVYIPRAHAATIREFPTLKAPWKDWPSGTSWPIVRCRVVNVRYRFPFKDYFRRTGETKCVSVVAILTLEVTGIPELSADREFPWPKPAFIDRQTRSALRMFEVSIFESGRAEYLFPEQLFLWRLKCLEDALRRRANDPCGLKVMATYAPDDDGEDPRFVEYDAEIIRYAEADEVGDEQLNKSAFESLLISWVDGNDHSEEQLSPWEVSMPDQAFNTPIPPPLSLPEKRAVANTLRALENDKSFKAFLSPVDGMRYIDYLTRVEVPMDIGTIKERLGQDYYTSTLSVVSDVKLIRDNCLKYNGPDEIGLLAVQLHVDFRQMLKEELRNLGVATSTIAGLDEDTDVVIRPNQVLPPSDSQGPRTRSVGANVSSLELLPPPASLPPVRSTRMSARNRPDAEMPESSLRERAAGRSDQRSNSAGRSVIGGDEIGPNGSTARGTRHSRRGLDGGTTQDSGGSPRRANAKSELRSRSTKATRGRHQGVEERDNKKHSRNAAASSRPLRSERSTKRVRYDQDDDKDTDVEEEYEDESRDGASEESEDFSAEEDNEVDGDDGKLEGNHTRRSRRSSAQRRSVLEVALPSDSPRRQSPRSKTATSYVDDESDIDLHAEDDELRTAARRKTRKSAFADSDKPSPRKRQVSKTRGKVKNDDFDSDDFEKEATAKRGRTRSLRASSHLSAKSPSSRRQRQTRSSKAFEEEDSGVDDSDHHSHQVDEKEVFATPSRKVARARKGQSEEVPKSLPESRSRGSRRSGVLSSKPYQELDSERGVESDSDERPTPSRSRSRTNGRGIAKRPLSAESPPSRSARLSRSSKAYQEEDSDVDDSDRHSDQDDEEETLTPPSRKRTEGRMGRSQEAPKTVPESRALASRRSRVSSLKSYQELDSEDVEESDLDEKPTPSRSRSRTPGKGAAKRPGKNNSNIAEPAAKRSRVTAQGKQVQLPELARWPQVPLKKITAVARGTLEEMRLLDSEKGAFGVPVEEAFPGIEMAYRRVVSHPMDFRTIEEERLPTYDSISQLQDDLTLVFKNCVSFNGKDTEYGRYAVMMLEQLGDVFQRVCQENRVRLPAGWNQV